MNDSIPCPFCASADVVFAKSDDRTPRADKAKGGVFFACLGCGAWGGEADTREEALKLWNRRSGYLGARAEEGDGA